MLLPRTTEAATTLTANERGQCLKIGRIRMLEKPFCNWWIWKSGSILKNRDATKLTPSLKTAVFGQRNYHQKINPYCSFKYRNCCLMRKTHRRRSSQSLECSSSSRDRSAMHQPYTQPPTRVLTRPMRIPTPKPAHQMYWRWQCTH